MKKLMLRILPLMLILQLGIGTVQALALDTKAPIETELVIQNNEEAIIEDSEDEVLNEEEISSTSLENENVVETEEPLHKPEQAQENQTLNKIKEDDSVGTDEKVVVLEKEVKKEVKKVAGKIVSKSTMRIAADEITENILSNIQFLDGNGAPVTTAKPMKPGDKLSVELDWALPNDHDNKAGDTYSFKLPEQMLIASVQRGNLTDADGTVYGTYEVDKSGNVVFTFSEEIERNSNINGHFKINSQLKEDLSGSINHELIVDVPGGRDFSQSIIVTPSTGSSLTKSGVLDQPQNPKNIIWSIDVNKKLDALGQLNIADTIPAGLKLVPGSIKVYELNMNINGTATLGDAVAGNYTTFPITIADGTKAYRIQYETEILEKTDAKYVNKTTLTTDGKTINAEASVSTQYSKPMAKSGGKYNPETHEIDWTILFNQREDQVKQQDAFFDDYFTNRMALVSNSMVVEVLTYDADGKEVWTKVPASEYTIIDNPASIPDDKNGFKLQFNKDINQAYRITYKTKLTGELALNQKITNTVVGLGQKPITVNKEINNTFIVKDHGTIDYENKIIPWTLTVNEDLKNLSDVVISELFTNKGLTLVENSVTVKTAAGENIPFTIENKGAEGFKIKISEDFNEKVIIKYKTNFDTTATKDGKNTFSNAATISGKYDGKVFVGIDTDSVTPGEKSQNNGYKSGEYSYLTKHFKWKIGVNYNKEHVDKLVVEDVSPEGLKVILDSIKIYKLDLSAGGEGVHAGEFTKFTVEETVKDGKPAFVITFNVPVDDAFQIVYNSEDADGIIEGEYNNDAIVTGTDKESDLHAKVPVLHGGELAVKSGKQEDDVINWQVQYNFSQSSLSNAKLVDHPSQNQFVLADSFHVYKATPDSANTGKFIKGEEISPTKYAVTIADDGSFELLFKDDIHEGYYIEYQSYINAAPGEYIENKAWAESDQKDSENKPTSETIKVILTESSASGTGETGSLTINKIDAFNKLVFLQGTEFKLWAVDKDLNKKFELKSSVTDESGKIIFDKLLYKDYIIEETKSTDGYLIPIINEFVVTIDQNETAITVENKPENPKGELIITKVSKENNNDLLQGAIFNLLNEQGEIVLENLKTDVNGGLAVKVPLTILLDEAGEPISLENSFTLVEKTAPIGYVNDNRTWPVIIKYGETTALTIENDKIKEEVKEPEEEEDPPKTDPEEEDPSEEETTPEKKNPSVKKEEHENLTDKKEAIKNTLLPQTVISNEAYYYLLGFLFILLGTYTVLKGRKNNNV